MCSSLTIASRDGIAITSFAQLQFFEQKETATTYILNDSKATREQIDDLYGS
jgi:hypothetical protein